MPIKPLNYHILVTPAATNVSRSGIVTTTKDPVATLGTVKAISDLSAKKVPELKVGDYILFEPNKGDKMPDSEDEIMHVEEALCIVKAKSIDEALQLIGELKQGAIPGLPNF